MNYRVDFQSVKKFSKLATTPDYQMVIDDAEINVGQLSDIINIFKTRAYTRLIKKFVS